MIFYPHILSGSNQLKASVSGLIRRLQTTVEHIRVTNAEPADDMEQGEVVYLVAGVRQARHAIATASATSEAIGVCCEDIENEETGIVRTNGKAWVRFEGSLVPAPAAGEPAYVSASTKGRATNVMTAVPGQFVSQIGVVLDASLYATRGGCYVQLQRCCSPRQVV